MEEKLIAAKARLEIAGKAQNETQEKLDDVQDRLERHEKFKQDFESNLGTSAGS